MLPIPIQESKSADNTEFNQYLTLKNAFPYTHKGYRLSDILATDFLFYAYQKLPDLSKNQARQLMFEVADFSTCANIFEENRVVFSLLDGYGTDYQNLLNQVMEEIDHPLLFTNQIQPTGTFAPWNIISSFIQIVGSLHFKGIKWKHLRYFYVRLVFYKNYINQLEKQVKVVNSKSYVAFRSAIAMDSILCQFFRKKGIPTYCLQHAIYHPVSAYKLKIPLDAINLENLQSDYLLAWGEYSREALIKQGHPESKFILAGHPYFKKEIVLHLHNKNLKTGILCLSRDEDLQGNLKLIEIAGKMIENGFIIYVKMHPRSRPENYLPYIHQNKLELLDLNRTAIDYISEKKLEFALVYNSTVYYEFYLNNVIALRYSVNENAIPEGMNDDFNSYEGILLRIKQFEKMETSKINEDAFLFLKKYFEFGKNNYAKFLN